MPRRAFFFYRRLDLRLWNQILAFICIALTAFSGLSVHADLIAPEQIRPHIEFLAAPEQAGRSGAAKVHSRDYIVNSFRESGLKPLFDGEWTQTVPARVEGSGPEAESGDNIGAFILGTDPDLQNEWILINAHYDHLGVNYGYVYPGADDNASGVSMMLEVAKMIQKNPLKRNVAFVAFDFEESLLWGSRWFIGHTPMPIEEIKLSITADMIGRSLGGLSLPTVFVLGSEHSGLVNDTISNLDVPAGLEIARLGTDMIGTRSDYGPFRDQRIPFLFFSTGEHPDYHRPSDTADRIEFEKCARICTVILRLVQSVGNSEESPEWRLAEYDKVEEARVVNTIVQHLLSAEERGEVKLSGTNKFFISQMLSKTNYMIRKGQVSDTERKWIARSAMFLMAAVL